MIAQHGGTLFFETKAVHEDQTLDEALGRMRLEEGIMNDRLKFETVCPNNHNQTVDFTQKEFEAALQSNTLVLHCNTCDTDWPPSKEEIATIRKSFAKNAA